MLNPQDYTPNTAIGSQAYGARGLGEHPLFAQSLRHWRPVLDMLGGQPRLQDMAARYLPQQEGEKDHDYLLRKERAVLEDHFNHGIHTLATAPFSQPVAVQSGPALPMMWQENVDAAESTLTEFAERVLREVLTFGIAHVGVFLPAFDGIPSLWDMEDRRLWPYFRLLPTTNLYDWLTNKREQVVEIREVQYSYEQDHELNVRVLLYDAAGYRELQVQRGTDGKMYMTDDPADVPRQPYTGDPSLRLDGPPIIQAYASQPQHPMIGRSPFGDCAAVNIELFSQQNAKYQYLRSATTRMQVLKQIDVRDLEESEEVSQGAASSADRFWVSSEDRRVSQRILIGKDGDVFFVSPGVEAAEPLTVTITDLRDYLQQRFSGNTAAPGPQMTATQTLLGTVAARSAVRSAVASVDDALTKAMRVGYRLLGQEPPPDLSVTIDRTYEEALFTAPPTEPPTDPPTEPPTGE